MESELKNATLSELMAAYNARAEAEERAKKSDATAKESDARAKESDARSKESDARAKEAVARAEESEALLKGLCYAFKQFGYALNGGAQRSCRSVSNEY